MNSLITPLTIQKILLVLAEDAGHEAARADTMACWNAATDNRDIVFQITSSAGTVFNGRVLGEWLTLTTNEIMDKLIDKYPLAFAPKVNQAELVAQKIQEAVKRALEGLEIARIATIELREATK
jgi:hypothetical protein